MAHIIPDGFRPEEFLNDRQLAEFYAEKAVKTPSDKREAAERVARHFEQSAVLTDLRVRAEANRTVADA